MMNEEPSYKNPQNPLTPPSVDQMIIEFLKRHEVYIQPRSVGAWNGWDYLFTLDAFLFDDGSMSHIANTLFYLNRSNQISKSAEEWGTWKRWALDHKNFDQYKDEVIQSIHINNEKLHLCALS